MVKTNEFHQAVSNGDAGRVRQLLKQDPSLVHAPGLDGGRPLHFCTSVEIAEFLLDAGAELDARDDDHGSTPAQWLVREAPEVVRLLLERGAEADLFLAAALGDLELAQALVEDDPAWTSYRIGNNLGPFPGIGHGVPGHGGRGGTILQWTVGFNCSAQEAAFHRGHEEIFRYLMERTPPRPRLLVACTLGDRDLAQRIVSQQPDLVGQLDSEDQQLLAKFCWETNKDIEVVRLMLDLGFPVAVPEQNHGFSALHNAAWCGDPALVKLLLDHGHPVDLRDPEYNSTAIGFAIHSCIEAKRHPSGQFAEVIELLLAAGAPLDETQQTVGHPGIDRVLRRILGWA